MYYCHRFSDPFPEIESAFVTSFDSAYVCGRPKGLRDVDGA